MSAPLVSVIIPTRNRAELLRRSIHSVLAQTHADLELIVVDDASTDHTRQVLDEVTDGRLRRVHLAQNGGAAAARNHGIRGARGHWIAFNDDDDIWLITKLERQLEALWAADPAPDWCLCGFIRHQAASSYYVGGPWYWKQLDFRRGNGRDTADGSPDWSLIATPTWLIRKEALERAGLFDERIRSYDDWELALRLDATCTRTFLDEPLFIQDLIHGGGLTLNERARATDLRLIVEKHGARWAGHPDVSARHQFVIGHIETLNDLLPSGRRALLASIRIRPWRWHPWLALLLSFASGPWRRLLFRYTRSPIQSIMRRMRRRLRLPP